MVLDKPFCSIEKRLWISHDGFARQERFQIACKISCGRIAILWLQLHRFVANRGERFGNAQINIIDFTEVASLDASEYLCQVVRGCRRVLQGDLVCQ